MSKDRTMHTQLLVLGGGPGGYAAAFLAADLGMNVTILDQSPTLGGVCLQMGCIPSKALLHVSKVINEVAELQHWGVQYEAPKIDLEAVRSKKEKIIQTLSKGLQQLAKRRKVNVVNARGVFVESRKVRVEPTAENEKETITFDHCILAVGSSPAIPPFLNIDSPRVMDSTTALQLQEIPERLLVIGGGYIGLELGTVYAALGSKVSVVELTDGLLPGADRDLVRPLQKRLKASFENFYLSTKVTGIKDIGTAVEVSFEGEAKQGSESFDRVLVAVGRRPNSQNIGLENTDVEIDERGFVKTNDQQQTADPKIFAIGDIAGEPMLAHKASHEGKVAVEVLSGKSVNFDSSAIPAVVFTDPEIAWVGLTQDEAKRQGVEVQVAQYPWAASGRAQAVGRTEGMTKIVIEPESNKILGVGIVGAGAGELIAEAVLAMKMNSTVEDLCEAIHPHPTLSETLAFAAEVHLGIATEVYRPKRERK